MDTFILILFMFCVPMLVLSIFDIIFTIIDFGIYCATGKCFRHNTL